MGLIYIIIAEILWAGEIIFIRKFIPNLNPLFIALATPVLASIFTFPCLFFVKEKVAFKDWFLIAILGFFSLFLAQFLYVKGIQKSTNSFSIALTTLTLPLFALIFSYLFLKETITLKIIIGGVFMIVGFLLILI